MQSSAFLVLANGIDAAGHLSNDAKATVDLALEHAHDKPDWWLIMSGRVSYKADFVPPISEAEAMKDYAVTQGAAPVRILTEVESRDTFGNAYFIRVNLLEPLGITAIEVVAGPNHSRERLEYIFRKVMGSAISYSFIMHDSERPEEAAREQESLQKLKAMFDDIPDGDTEALYARMRSQHPAYKG